MVKYFIQLKKMFDRKTESMLKIEKMNDGSFISV